MTIALRTPKTTLRRHVERRPQEYALRFVGLTGRVMEPSRLVESVDRRGPAAASSRRVLTSPARK